MEEEGGADASKTGGRKEKRKALKKLKRKKCRQQIAEAERIQQELRLVDPEEELRVLKEQQLEAEREELERKEFEENERLWLQKEQQAKEEFERKQQEKKNEPPPAEEEEDGDYIDGPSEIIWEGNEITIKKHRVKVIKEANKTKQKDKPTEKDRPTHNPPPPRSAFQLSLNKVKLDHDPNYGTEQDKTHCPFHFKTGVCRFGTRCSRVHVYPEKSCTLLIKNMYTGPGLAWEHDEGLEYTDEEVAEQFEEFYEDVHSEFMKSGELVNFKVCRNSSPHLRGNVYIHYRSEDSAVAACLALTGRFYAGKQMFPEFVGVTKWKAALCGDYLKAHYGACSRGASCNFLHCFRNPGGEYDWADHDAPPPRTWQQKMAILFGHQSDYEHHTLSERDDPWKIDRDEHRERRRGRESHRDDHYQRRRGRESHQDDHYERKRGREFYEDDHRGRKSGRDKHKHGEDRDTSHGKENGKHSRKTSRKRSESDDEHETRRYKRSTREEHSDDSSEHKRSKRSSHWDDQSDSSRRRHRHRSNSSSTTIIAKDRWQGGS